MVREEVPTRVSSRNCSGSLRKNVASYIVWVAEVWASSMQHPVVLVVAYGDHEKEREGGASAQAHSQAPGLGWLLLVPRMQQLLSTKAENTLVSKKAEKYGQSCSGFSDRNDVLFVELLSAVHPLL